MPADCEKRREECIKLMNDLAERAADRAAAKAVRETFAILGVDVDKPKDVEEFRQDLRFGRLLRRAADRGLMATVAALATALAAAVGLGVYFKLKG